MDGQTDGRTKNGQTNTQNYTNFEKNLAMMVIYVPVKFEFDRTNFFRVRVQKQKCGQTDGWTNGQKTDKKMDKQTDKRTEFHQFRKEPNYDGDLCPRRNENVDGQTDGQTYGQTNGQNYTNFERNLVAQYSFCYAPALQQN